jgi:cysteine desulfuration protein SufE
MSPADQEAALREAFSIIPDPHERLSAIVSGCAGAGLPEVEKRDDRLVPGCVSSVWLTGQVESGMLHLRWDAASPLVRGLAGLICRVYHGAPAAEAAAHDTQILEGLGLTRQISPTRLNGLENVALRIRALAAAHH